MATQRVNHNKPARKRRPPARSIEERENQMINLAMDVAEQIMESGNPPAQIVTHYLKLGSSREKLEQERLKNEVSLLQTKREAMASAKRVEELYIEAMNAFKSYTGEPMPFQDDNDGED